MILDIEKVYINIKGEKTSDYQPFLELPEPFGRNEFFYDDLWSYDSEKLESIKNQYKDHNFGFYNTYELNKKIYNTTLMAALSDGASVNHKSGVTYVTSNNIPWETRWIKLKTKQQKYHLTQVIFKEL